MAKIVTENIEKWCKKLHTKLRLLIYSEKNIANKQLHFFIYAIHGFVSKNKLEENDLLILKVTSII